MRYQALAPLRHVCNGRLFGNGAEEVNVDVGIIYDWNGLAFLPQDAEQADLRRLSVVIRDSNV